MDEQHEHDSAPDQHARTGGAGDAVEPVSTGHPQVDDVLGTLHALSELPVDQHVAVFEAAHTALREALSGARQADPARG